MFDWEDEAQENEFQSELERFEKQLQEDTVGFYDAEQIEHFIDYFLSMGDFTRAEQTAEVGIRLYSFNALFFLRKAQALSAIGSLKQALMALSEAEKLDHKSAEILSTKATIFSQMHDSKRAINLFTRALEFSTEEEANEIYNDLISEYINLREFEKAIKYIQLLLQENPKNEVLIYELAFCYERLEKLEEAKKVYIDFLEEYPMSFTAWYNLGNTYSKSDEHELALEAYEFCLTINARFTPAAFNKGNAELNLEKYDDAVNSFTYCLQNDGDDAMTLCYLGEAYEQLEQLDESWSYYQKALSINPDLSEAWLGLGIVKDLQGKPKECLHYIERAIEIDPHMDGYFHVYAGALENAEMLPEAEEAYLACLTLNSENEDCFYDYVSYLFEHNTTAVSKFILDYDEKYKYFFSRVAVVYLFWTQGHIDIAVQAYKMLLEQDIEEAKELFIRFPELKTVEEFVNLTPKTE